MIQEEILEYNKRCAEFLGFQETKIGYYDAEESLLGIERDNTFDDFDLNFHSDWNWIMELKEKICQLNIVDEFNTHYDSVAKGFRCSILPSYKNTFDSFYTKVLTNEKEAVVNAINRFLIWYNENK